MDLSPAGGGTLLQTQRNTQERDVAMLTTDMTQLCREIVGMRKRRGEMMNAMARAAQDRRHSVNELCLQFHSARMAMSQRAKGARLAFLKALKHTVSAQQQAMRSDLAGVRKAWAGQA